jgi:pentatricopeptide repeat protein
MYGRCGDLDAAMLIFNSIQKKDVVLWNTIISLFTKQGHATKAMKLFRQMKSEGFVPNAFVYTTVLPKCNKLFIGKELHENIIEGKISLTTELQNSLITMYGNCGDLDAAMLIFNSIHKKVVVSWNTIISASIKQGNATKAMELFLQMKSEGFIPDEITYASVLPICSLSVGKELHEAIKKDKIKLTIQIQIGLITMYGNGGDLETAKLIFNSINQQNILSWNNIVSSFSNPGTTKNLLKYFMEHKYYQ